MKKYEKNNRKIMHQYVKMFRTAQTVDKLLGLE